MKNDVSNLSKNEMIMLIHDQEQEIEELKARLEQAEGQLSSFEIKTENAGTLADAAAQISSLFEAAQATAETYLSNIRLRDERCEEIIAEVEKRADGILAEAEEMAKKRLANIDLEIEEKWAVIESRLLVMYDSHQGLKELVESGIFNIPGTK